MSEQRISEQELAETPDLHGAYPRLDDAQIAALGAFGQRREVQPGERLLRGVAGGSAALPRRRSNTDKEAEMTVGPQPGPADVLARLGRHWGWIMAFGTITLLAGVATLAWPGRTLIVVAVLFGIQLTVTGIFRFVAAFASDDLTGGTRVLLAVLGVLSLIIGLYAVRHVLITLLALALLLGIFWIINGAVELFMALSLPELENRAWTGVMGIVSIVAGVVVLAYPGISLLVLAVVLSIWLLFYGVMQITLALRLRSLAHRAGVRAVHAA